MKCLNCGVELFEVDIVTTTTKEVEEGEGIFGGSTAYDKDVYRCPKCFTTRKFKTRL